MITVINNLKSAALLFSGGVDSTLMYYLYLTQTDTKLDLYVVNRTNNPINRAFTLYNTLSQQWNDTRTTLTKIDIPDMQTYDQVPYVCNILKDKYDNIIFSGNQYPDDNSIRPKFAKSMIQMSWINEHSYIVAPLMEYNKSDIIAAYYYYGIEDVLPLTHSCGSPQQEPCRECFNCKERAWAYNKINRPVNYGV